jgi:hypothetical protein
VYEGESLVARCGDLRRRQMKNPRLVFVAAVTSVALVGVGAPAAAAETSQPAAPAIHMT